HPTDVALAPNGSLYIADSLNKRIRRIGVDGIITTVAGNGTSWPALNVDGLPATSVGLAMPWGVAVAPDGRLYIADKVANLIYRVEPDGLITRVAGNGGTGFSGDGGLAVNASLNQPTDIALGPDGSLYIADSENNRIRRVGIDGIITTVAGSGPLGSLNGQSSGDGGPATRARLNAPNPLAVPPHRTP